MNDFVVESPILDLLEWDRLVIPEIGEAVNGSQSR